jgi:hypothetical protein
MRFSIVLVSGLAACGGGMGDDDDGEVVNCDLETRDDEFAIGLSKTGDAGTLGFTLMNATPAPPIRGDNSWVIQINQMTSGAIGAPVDGADIFVSPFMPDHGHPAAKTVVIEATGNPGEYEMSPINLWMPGMWETTIDATSAGGDDLVVFRFCIPS